MRPPRRPHLLVLVHGVHGEATDFSLVSSLLRKPHLSVLSSRASRSASGSTADGIERAGERVADEIASACDALSADGGDITFVGHSNGGLVSRWALGALEERGVLERWRPNAFVSLSSPHLGVSRKGGGALGHHAVGEVRRSRVSAHRYRTWHATPHFRIWSVVSLTLSRFGQRASES